MIMKKSRKRLIIVLALLLIVYFVFQDRISGTCQVYRLVTKVTGVISEGSDQYNLKIGAGIGEGKERDTLTAVFSRQGNPLFTANVSYNKSRYVILHRGDSTKLIISDPGLVIAGKSDTAAHFDVAGLLGEILKDYPGTHFIPDMSWSKRAGFTAWLFLNGRFDRQKIHGQKYQIIRLDNKLVESAEFRMGNHGNHFFLKIKNKKQQIALSVRLTKEAPPEPMLPPSGNLKKLVVNGDELNTSIYRGALRAGGLLLENIKPPKPDGIERRWGQGLLTYVNGNRVLIAKGTHRELGEAHGALLKPEIRKLVDATLYTINWVYTLEKGHWFLDDLRSAYHREAPFIPEKYQDEMKGLARTSGISLEEIRLTNVFPALFHCSGFALFGDATVNGKLYHGRILDYITELGLQYYPVVMIFKPDSGYAFANVSFAGFIGSVTGINEKQVTFGEMGGGGEGNWDGMPMAFLMREGMERASTLEEALTIFRTTPRTCEYYYVISDGKGPDARGLATTPEKFEVIKPGQYHPLLPEPVKDAVLMSAGDRYKKLAERVKAEYGRVDAQKAIRLMDRPVAMKAALHAVLFAPQTLEFWVANAGPHTPAPMEPYTHYNMMELLKKLDQQKH